MCRKSGSSDVSPIFTEGFIPGQEANRKNHAGRIIFFEDFYCNKGLHEAILFIGGKYEITFDLLKTPMSVSFMLFATAHFLFVRK